MSLRHLRSLFRIIYNYFIPFISPRAFIKYLKWYLLGGDKNETFTSTRLPTPYALSDPQKLFTNYFLIISIPSQSQSHIESKRLI